MKNQTADVPMKAHPVNPVHPVTGFTLNEIIGKFRGADHTHIDVNLLQPLLYAA